MLDMKVQVVSLALLTFFASTATARPIAQWSQKQPSSYKMRLSPEITKHFITNPAGGDITSTVNQNLQSKPVVQETPGFLEQADGVAHAITTTISGIAGSTINSFVDGSAWSTLNFLLGPIAQ